MSDVGMSILYLLWLSVNRRRVPKALPEIEHNVILVYGVTNVDGSGYNRMDDDQDIKSKVGGAIINGEYRSQETKAST